MSSITIYLVLKPFLFPPLNETESSLQAAGCSAKKPRTALGPKKLAKNHMWSPAVEVGFHISLVFHVLGCCFLRLKMFF